MHIINRFTKYLPQALVVMLCFFAIRALLTPGYFSMHDDEQVGRLYEMHKIISDGQIPPRWVPDLGFGYGYPLFNFYPPLVYYVGEMFSIIGFSYIVSTKIVMGLGFIFSAFFMYAWVKNRFGTWAGILSAVLYTYAPYHAVDLYVRGDLAEFFSFVWIPAILYAYDKLFRKNTVLSSVFAGIYLGLLILTHNLTALEFLPFFCFYFVFLLYEYRTKFRQIFPLLALSGGIALGISAYFWIPSLFEKQYTLVDKILTGELADYRLYFVCLNQYWNSSWGYGGAGPGCMDGLSFQVGKIQLLLSALSLVVYIAAVSLRKLKTGLPYIPFLFTLILLSLFMGTEYSSFIWSVVPPFSYIQFPWRFLLLSDVFTAGIAGSLVFILQKYFSDTLAKGLVIVAILGTIFLLGKYFQPQTYLPITDEYYIKNHGIDWYVSSLSYEYVPSGVATRLSNLRTTKLAIDKPDIPQMSYNVLSGNMVVKEQVNKSQVKEYLVQTSGSGTLRINTFSFPGWKAYIDGKEIQYSDNNKLKLINFPIPNGMHKITVVFSNTPVRLFANNISLFALIVIIYIFGYYMSVIVKKRL